jgi:acyl-CoA synthetase (AMP-forming)/AMP-acid ligase II
VFAGYWQQPDATAEAMAGGWFHTGDGGRLDAEGYLTISDRKKDVIITGGENVSSIEVEDALYQHPAVAEAAVFGIPSDEWGETVKALVVLEEGATRQRPTSSRTAELLALQVPDVHRARRGDRSHRDGKVQKFSCGLPIGRGGRDSSAT